MSDKFKKGDVVDFRFETFSGMGIVTRSRGHGIWDVVTEAPHQDVRCFDEHAEKTNPPLNVFDLIREKQSG